MSENILKQAIDIVIDRQGSYDAPEDNFKRIADFWNTYLTNKPKHDKIDSSDVAIMMILMKVARITFSYKEDSAIDIAGYAQCLSQVENSNIDK